jgi:putative FmdB family regulatory protein
VPTYEYRCKDCDHEFDVVQSFSDAALTECPSCGGNLRKVFGNVGITFKGSGFYKTDSRSGTGNGSKADKKSDGDSGAKQESSSKESSAKESSSSSSSSSKESSSSGSSASDSSSSKSPASA